MQPGVWGGCEVLYNLISQLFIFFIRVSFYKIWLPVCWPKHLKTNEVETIPHYIQFSRYLLSGKTGCRIGEIKIIERYQCIDLGIHLRFIESGELFSRTFEAFATTFLAFLHLYLEYKFFYLLLFVFPWLFCVLCFYDPYWLSIKPAKIHSDKFAILNDRYVWEGYIVARLVWQQYGELIDQQVYGVNQKAKFEFNF